MAFVQIMEFRTSDIERAWRGAAARGGSLRRSLPCPPSPLCQAGPAEWLPRYDKGQGPPKGIGGMDLREDGAFLLRANSSEPHPSP